MAHIGIDCRITSRGWVDAGDYIGVMESWELWGVL